MNSVTEGYTDRVASRGRIGDETYTDDKNEWNTAAFEKKLNQNSDWKNHDGTKKITRVQDISISANATNISSCTTERQNWPYDDAPCRMFGGMNTKSGPEAAALNKEYFDNNFADRSQETKMRFDDDVDNDNDDDIAELASECSLGSNDAKGEDSNSFASDNAQGPVTKTISSNKVSNIESDEEKMYAEYLEDVHGNQSTKRMTSASSLREQQMKTSSSISGNRTGVTSTSSFQHLSMKMSRRGSTGSGPISGSVGAQNTGAQNGSTAARRLFSTVTRRSSSTDLQKSGSGIFGRKSSTDLKSSARSGSLDSHSSHSRNATFTHKSPAAERALKAFGIFRGTRSTSQTSTSKDETQHNQQQKKNYTQKSSNHDSRPEDFVRCNTDGKGSSSMNRRQSYSSDYADTESRHSRDMSTSSVKPASSMAKALRRASTGAGLDSATYHGDSTTRASSRSRSSRTSGSNRRNGGVPRHKSTDDPSVMPPNYNESTVQSSRRRGSQDELGTATLHGTGGKSAVSRIRRTGGSSKDTEVNESRTSRRESSVDNGGTIDRRSKFKRAMSTENVRRPEDYGPNGGKVQVETEETVVKRRGGRRNAVAHEASTRGHETTRRNAEDRASVSSSSYSDENIESDEDSFADEDEMKGKKTNSRRNEQTTKSVSQRSGSTKEKYQQNVPVKVQSTVRDVLELLHDNKTIKLRDMQDKDNRSMIHFFLFEHKMGVSLAQMKKSIQQDILEDPDEALRRLPLPLYVPEPAN